MAEQEIANREVSLCSEPIFESLAPKSVTGNKTDKALTT